MKKKSEYDVFRSEKLAKQLAQADGHSIAYYRGKKVKKDKKRSRMKTLLEKAKAVEVRQRNIAPPTDEEIELMFAWMKGDITLKQMNIAFGNNKGDKYSGNILYRVAVWMREAYRQGKIKLTKGGE